MLYVCIVTRGAVSARVWEVSVSSCRCGMFVCIMWQFVNAGRGCKR